MHQLTTAHAMQGMSKEKKRTGKSRREIYITCLPQCARFEHTGTHKPSGLLDTADTHSLKSQLCNLAPPFSQEEEETDMQSENVGGYQLHSWVDQQHTTDCSVSCVGSICKHSSQTCVTLRVTCTTSIVALHTCQKWYNVKQGSSTLFSLHWHVCYARPCS